MSAGYNALSKKCPTYQKALLEEKKRTNRRDAK